MTANLLALNNNYGEWDISFEFDVTSAGTALVAPVTFPAASIYNNPRGDTILGVVHNSAGNWSVVFENAQNLMLVEVLAHSAAIGNAISPLTQAQVTNVQIGIANVPASLTPVAGVAPNPITVTIQTLGQIPAWSGNVTVTTNTATLTIPQLVTNVYVSAGTVSAFTANIRNAAPAQSKDVQVTYSATGVPTLNFLAADGVSTAQVQAVNMLGQPIDSNVATTISGWLALRVLRQPFGPSPV